MLCPVLLQFSRKWFGFKACVPHAFPWPLICLSSRNCAIPAFQLPYLMVISHFSLRETLCPATEKTSSSPKQHILCTPLVTTTVFLGSTMSFDNLFWALGLQLSRHMSSLSSIKETHSCLFSSISLSRCLEPKLTSDHSLNLDSSLIFFL